MCKVLAVAGIKPEVAAKKLWTFLIAATPFMSAYDKDGVRYLAQRKEYGLWGEKWLKPEEAWKVRDEAHVKDGLYKEKFKGLLLEERFTKFGVADPMMTHAVLLHARMATCEKSLANVHPFVRGDTALIHNGIIRNDHQLKKITSTCDSECILNEYVDKGVFNDPEAIQAVAKELRGYYACAILTKGQDGKQYLDIFKNTTSQLSATYVEELDSMVFCTNPEIVKETCKELKWSHGASFKVKDETLIRIDAATGDLISKHTFKEGYTWSNVDHDYSNGYEHGYGNYNRAPVTHLPTEEEKKSVLTIVKPPSQEITEEKRAVGPEKTGKSSEKDTDPDLTSDPFHCMGEGYMQ